MASSTKRPKTFLDILPAEVRADIYRLALVEDSPINIDDAMLAAERHGLSVWRACRDGKQPPPPPNDAVNGSYPRLRPALLATCRQIRDETSTIYHGENNFTAETINHVHLFVKVLDPQVQAALKTIRVLIPPLDYRRLEITFEALARDDCAKPFCALPVEVEGEGTVYTTEARSRYFENVRVTKVLGSGNGQIIVPAYETRRKVSLHRGRAASIL